MTKKAKVEIAEKFNLSLQLIDNQLFANSSFIIHHFHRDDKKNKLVN
jgi:hypothetical protein